MSVGSILVRTPQHLVLVDIGFGPRSIDLSELTGGAFGGDLVGGRLLDSLKAAQVRPDQIDAVVFTHLHLDHVGWLEDPQRPGRLTFENARYVTHRAEWDHWRRPENIALGAAASQAQIDLLAPHVETPSEEIDVVPGVRLVHTPGHTPGHVSVLVTGSAGRALVLGDAMHCPVELNHPGQTFVFDINPQAAEESRQAIHKILDSPDTWFAGGHFPDRVFGKAHSAESGGHDLIWHPLT
jgi:glyoxylase-like metal-dependent hydrolase (beta-lactamase superfamily II)